MASILMWLAVFCFIGFIMGLIGVLVPGRQWWRTTRKRAAQVMAGSCATFILTGILIGGQSSTSQPSHTTTASPPPSMSPTPDPVPDPVPQKVPATQPVKKVTKKDPPPGSSLELITHRYGPYLTVQVKTDLPQKTHMDITVERFFYEKGNSTAYSVEYFNAYYPVWLLNHPQPIHLNNAQWKHKLHSLQKNLAVLKKSDIPPIDRIEDEIIVSAFVVQRKDLYQEVSIPYAVTEDSTLPVAIPDPASILSDETYRQEIQQHVIRACYRTLLSNKKLLVTPTQGLTVNAMIKNMKRDGQYAPVQNLENEAVKVVAGQPQDVRMAFYAKSNLRCQAGGMQSKSLAP